MIDRYLFLDYLVPTWVRCATVVWLKKRGKKKSWGLSSSRSVIVHKRRRVINKSTGELSLPNRKRSIRFRRPKTSQRDGGAGIYKSIGYTRPKLARVCPPIHNRQWPPTGEMSNRNNFLLARNKIKMTRMLHSLPSNVRFQRWTWRCSSSTHLFL